MDEKMDGFYRQQQDKVKHLKSEFFSVIRQEIDSYRECIIKKLDPKKLQNDMDVSDKRAFKEWWQHELEKRERILKQKDQDQTQRVMRWYYDDRFYGSMQKGKQEIVSQTVEVAQSSKEQFSSLSQVTEEFYQKVKGETERYDRMKRVSAMVGSVLSGGAAALGLQTVGAAGVSFNLVLAVLFFGWLYFLYVLIVKRICQNVLIRNLGGYAQQQLRGFVADKPWKLAAEASLKGLSQRIQNLYRKHYEFVNQKLVLTPLEEMPEKTNAAAMLLAEYQLWGG